MRSERLLVLGFVLLGLALVLPLSAAVITVNSADDAGAGTLREALNTVNGAAPGANTINFAPALAGQTIHVLSNLPQLTHNATTINGDINADGKPDLAISGDQATIDNGLDIASANNIIKGLCINRCNYGLYIHGSSATGNNVYSCYLGTNLAGNAPAPNDNYGLYLYAASSTLVGGPTAAQRNVISGNYYYGIYMYRCPNTRVQSLYCGLNAAGTAQIPNASNGIYMQYSPSVTIGAAVAAAKTIVSGNASTGVQASYCSNLQVLHTYLGTNAAGTAAVPNNGNGLYLSGCNYAMIGGTEALQGNLISGNDSTGLYVYNSFSGPTVQGNQIGTNLAGTGSLPNTSQGVYLGFCSGALIGGTVAGARNMISGNADDGVYLNQCATATVAGNYLGLNKGGAGDLRNGGSGVEVYSSSAVTVGGTAAAARNLIVADGTGVSVAGELCSNIKVLNNYIGYAANGTTAFPCNSGVYVSNGARTVTIGSAAQPNRILATNAGISMSEVAGGCKIVGNRVGAPVNTTPYGTSGLVVSRCTPLVDRNTVLQQSSSGAEFYGSEATCLVTNNTFRKNDRGVYLDSNARPNLGDLTSPATNDNGNNTFAGNSDFDIYNATPNDIKAEGNTFASTSAETIDGRFIYDKLDNPYNGRVDYSPLKSGAPTVLSVPTVMTMAALPARGAGAQIVVTLSAAADLQVQVLNIAGRPIRLLPSVAGQAGVNALRWDGKSATGAPVPAGEYLITVTCRSADGHQQRQTARIYLTR